MSEKLINDEETCSLIIKIKKTEVKEFLCEGFDNDPDFVSNIKKFIKSELSRKNFVNRGIRKMQWQELDISSDKILSLFSILLRTQNEVSDKLRKLIKKVVAEGKEN